MTSIAIQGGDGDEGTLTTYSTGTVADLPLTATIDGVTIEVGISHVEGGCLRVVFEDSAFDPVPVESLPMEVVMADTTVTIANA